jgi:hypothetical protein
MYLPKISQYTSVSNESVYWLAAMGNMFALQSKVRIFNAHSYVLHK